MISLAAHLPAMRLAGVRRLLLLSGEAAWCRHQAQRLCHELPQAALWVGEAGIPAEVNALSVNQARSLLGQEVGHVVFDATRAFHAEALAAIGGAMQAGSWLLLLVPPWSRWAERPDADSLRWNDAPTPIATPHFVAHLQRACRTSVDIVLWREGEFAHIPTLTPRPAWQLPDGRPTPRQHQILEQIVSQPERVAVAIGARGRGKSTLAGMLAAKLTGRCWVTGPNRLATQTLCRAAGDIPFYAPDVLLAYCERQRPEAEWLLIDEAAAIPAPLLTALVHHFPRALLTTTTHGYEGTGRGFLLKVCAELPSWRLYTLSTPVRWGEDDPLEAWLNAALLFDEPREPLPVQQEEVTLRALPETLWQTVPAVMHAFYTLLTSAHYRTTPLDLRRLMDAGGNTLHGGFIREQPVAALWLTEEGGLDTELAQAVWAGTRRPPGNLVAQSLAAHGGQPQAAEMRSRRVNRIAVFPQWRRRGVARGLLATAVRQARAAGLDYVSVSFGYTPVLYQFWRACGFRLVRFGSAKEASSGCYTAMALIPLSAAAVALCERLELRLRRDAEFIRRQIGVTLPVTPADAWTLMEDDEQELRGFAFANRPLESARYALMRYLAANPEAPAVLQTLAADGLSAPGLAARYGLTGKKALLAFCRQTLADLLRADAQFNKKIE